MKTFEPLTATEHLEQLHLASHDWAQEAIEALDMQAESFDLVCLRDDLAQLLGCDVKPGNLHLLVGGVEKIMCERDQMRAKIALAMQELSGA